MKSWKLNTWASQQFWTAGIASPIFPKHSLANNDSCFALMWIRPSKMFIIRMPYCTPLSFLDISLGKWPVRGVVNRLLYKSIYCALCNGISENLRHKMQVNTPWFEFSSTVEKVTMSAWSFEPTTETYNETTDIVEWLPATVRCDDDKVQDYVENKPTHAKLMILLNTWVLLFVHRSCFAQSTILKLLDLKP